MVTVTRREEGRRPEKLAENAPLAGVVASTPLVESLYVQLLAQSSISGVAATGMTAGGAQPERLGCIVMVIDAGEFRELVVERTAALKARSRCRIVCVYEGELSDVVRWAQELDVFVFLKASAPFSVIASAVVLASYVKAYSVPVNLADQGRASVEIDRSLEVANLTARQLDVLRLLAKGYSNKAMAHSLLVSEPTVKLHLASLRRIFNATNRTEVLVKALKLGMLPSQ